MRKLRLGEVDAIIMGRDGEVIVRHRTEHIGVSRGESSPKLYTRRKGKSKVTERVVMYEIQPSS